jgi:hypothetical protein
VKFQITGKPSTTQLTVPTTYFFSDPALSTTVATEYGGPAEIDELVNGSTVVILIPADAGGIVVETTNGSGQATGLTLENVVDTNTSSDITVNGVPVTPGAPPLNIDGLQAGLSVKRGTFTLNGTISPSSTSKGLNPLSEQVVLKLGGYTFTIPAHGFKLASDGAYTYQGTIGSVSLNLRFKRLTGGKWSISGTGKPVSGLTNPVAVSVQVGDDLAAGSAIALFS